MLFNEINPNLRYSRIQKNYPTKDFFRAPDYRLFYNISGTGVISLNGKNYEITPGCLIFWPPDVTYKFFPDKKKPMVLIGFNFDFTQNFSHLAWDTFPKKVDDPECEILEKINFSDSVIFNSVLYLRDFYDIANDFIDVNFEFTSQSSYFRKRVSIMLTDILIKIMRRVDLDMKESGIKKIKPILDYIHFNYNKNITNKLLGEVFSYHPNYINKIMLESVGMSLHQYLINYRISNAITMLQTTDMSITQIAAATGFGDIKHFSKCFKQKTHSTPSAYRTL